MPITRTPLVDDDGSGTTGTILNNAWLQAIYDAIDALTAGMVPQAVGTFTPIDASGAALGALGSGSFLRMGPLVKISMSLSIPANASGAIVAIGGLPVAQHIAFYGALYQGYGPGHYRSFITNGTTIVTPMHAATGAPVTNIEVSGAAFHFHGTYLTDQP